MISPHLRFEGFDARSWTNFLSLFSPGVIDRIEEDASETEVPELGQQDAHNDQRAGSVVVLLDKEDRVLRAFHTLRGRIKDLSYGGPGELAGIAKTYAARHAIAIREGTLESMSDELALRLQRGDDYVTQCLAFLRLLRDAVETGRIHTAHNTFTGAPVPAPGVVRRALDILLPDEHAITLVLWNGNTIWTALALRRRGGMIDHVVGPDLISRWTGPLGGDWRRDHRFIASEISRSFAPVHLGIYAEVKTIRALLRSYAPGAWAKAIATREVVVHPTPPYIAVAVGADAARAVATKSSELLGGIDAISWIAPLANAVRGYVSEVASVTSILGFDPLKALSRSLSDERE